MQPAQVPPETEAAILEAQPPTADLQAQKRVAIGLSPRRPTARSVVRRPPRTAFTKGQQWALAGLIVAMIVATGLLIVAKATGATTSWPQVRMQLAAWVLGEALPGTPTLSSPLPDYGLRVEDTFTSKTGLLASNQQAGQWATDILPEQGVYRFQLWPGRLAWSTLAVEDLQAYWLEASFTIVDLMPEGYTGLIGRYQDAQNFYLFVIDGAGRYQVLLWQAGVLTTVQPWTPSAVINGAGYENVLALVDDGQALHFYANDQQLHTIADPRLSPGMSGLVGGAGERTMAEITIDWLRLYEPGQ